LETQYFGSAQPSHPPNTINKVRIDAAVNKVRIDAAVNTLSDSCVNNADGIHS
jgi:hypothetical protein